MPRPVGSSFADYGLVFGAGSLSGSELARRTWRDALDDDIFGLAAQLSYYFFLALFPAILFLLAIASFFPLANLADDLGRALGPFVSPQVLALIQDQMRRLANNENGGLLTFGVAGALWSSSAALVSIVGALNRAYDIEEGRPRWKVRLVAVALTIGAALFVLGALSLVLAGPTLADYLGKATGLGIGFEWTWLVLQWPLVFLLVSMALGLVYYFGPDADQDWSWITPGAVIATLLWLVVSLAFKVYVANFTDYNGAYGTVGGVIVLLLWFYLSSLAVLAGAELNAEIEDASPYGKAPGQKNSEGKRLLGRRAERAFRDRQNLTAASPPVAEFKEEMVPSGDPGADLSERVGLASMARRALELFRLVRRAFALLRSQPAGVRTAMVGAVVGLALLSSLRPRSHRTSPTATKRRASWAREDLEYGRSGE